MPEPCQVDEEGTYCTAHACGAHGQHCYKSGCPHCVIERAHVMAEFGRSAADFEADTPEAYMERLMAHAAEAAQDAEYHARSEAVGMQTVDRCNRCGVKFRWEGGSREHPGACEAVQRDLDAFGDEPF